MFFEEEEDLGEGPTSTRLRFSLFAFIFYQLLVDTKEVNSAEEFLGGNNPFLKAKMIRQCLREYVELYEKRISHEDL